MNPSHRKRNWIFFLSAIVIVGSACNLFRALNPADQVISEIEEATTQIPVDEIEESLDAIATEIPEGLGDIGDLLDLGDLGDLEATAQAIQEGYQPGEVPPDIPVVEGPTEVSFSSKNLVTYLTPVAFDAVLAFYQSEMPANDWQSVEEDHVFNQNVAILHYTKPDRDAVVSISTDDENGKTFVMIAIEAK